MNTNRTSRAKAIAAAGPFEASGRAKALLKTEAVAAAVALMVAFTVVTAIIAVRALAM